MAETDNPEAPIVAPRAARFGEGPEGKVARRERGHSGHQTGPVGRIGQFLHDVRAEMKRVSWPTLQHVQNTTIITLVAVVFFAVYLFLVDQGLSRLILGIEWLVEKIARGLGLA
ncbi:MAG TPA: preprotein translocase subunit SecE [Pyrinomonadaceae bacterium]|nr:preprotein translocase subunit SecE [Pyrinomonadaceae bacterium]